jgi:acetyl esterase/lipase
MRVANLVRLLAGGLLLATALLAIAPAPTHLLWMVAIGVTELGYVFAAVCLLAAVALNNKTRAGRVAVGCSITAAVIALSPLVRALPAATAANTAIRYGVLFAGFPMQQVQSRTIVYTKVEGTELFLDFYPAAGRRKAPVLLSVHGGSWSSGDNQDFIAFDQYFASRGFAVADVLYRLAPRWRYPAASDDVRSAIEFLAHEEERLKIDANQIVLVGRSAGAQIALDVAYSGHDPRIRGVISFYGPTDLRWSWNNPGNPRVIDTRKVLFDYLGGDPAVASWAYDAASPVNRVTSSAPPTLLLHGERDELVSVYHTTELSRRLRQAGVFHVSIVLPWSTHGFDYFLRGPGGQIGTSAIERFLERILPSGA